jgi:hypothetical protein
MLRGIIVGLATLVFIIAMILFFRLAPIEFTSLPC